MPTSNYSCCFFKGRQDMNNSPKNYITENLDSFFTKMSDSMHNTGFIRAYKKDYTLKIENRLPLNEYFPRVFSDIFNLIVEEKYNSPVFSIPV